MMSDKNPIATDCYDLVEKNVESHMRPYIQASMHEDERLYRKMDNIEKLLKKMSDNKTHSTINSVLITFLFIGMAVLLSGC